jgi:glutathione synthase/RimK-type ligase-like ATP-grasp enzyme
MQIINDGNVVYDGLVNWGLVSKDCLYIVGILTPEAIKIMKQYMEYNFQTCIIQCYKYIVEDQVGINKVLVIDGEIKSKYSIIVSMREEMMVSNYLLYHTASKEIIQ